MDSGGIPNRGHTSGFIVSSKIHVDAQSLGDPSAAGLNREATYLPLAEADSDSQDLGSGAWGADVAVSTDHRGAPGVPLIGLEWDDQSLNSEVAGDSPLDTASTVNIQSTSSSAAAAAAERGLLLANAAGQRRPGEVSVVHQTASTEAVGLRETLSFANSTPHGPAVGSLTADPDRGSASWGEKSMLPQSANLSGETLESVGDKPSREPITTAPAQLQSRTTVTTPPPPPPPGDSVPTATVPTDRSTADGMTRLSTTAAYVQSTNSAASKLSKPTGLLKSTRWKLSWSSSPNMRPQASKEQGQRTTSGRILSVVGHGAIGTGVSNNTANGDKVESHVSPAPPVGTDAHQRLTPAKNLSAVSLSTSSPSSSSPSPPSKAVSPWTPGAAASSLKKATVQPKPRPPASSSDDRPATPCQCKERFHLNCLCGLSSGNSMSCSHNHNRSCRTTTKTSQSWIEGTAKK